MRLLRLVLCIAISVPASRVFAWEFIDLQPANLPFAHSFVSDMDQGQFVGAISSRAAIWRSESPTSYSYLQPPNNMVSFAWAIRGEEEVGRTDTHASMWHGTKSFVDLHPAGYIGSEAFSTDGEFQVGFGELQDSHLHALLWHGTAESVTDLTPIGARNAVAQGIDNGIQVGSISFSDSSAGAAYWRGSAESWHFLSPPDMFSDAYDIEGDDIVGTTYFGRPNAEHGHAWLWRGLGQEQIDMHPGEEWDWSAAYITAGGYQIGTVHGLVGGRSALWHGSASSFVDIQQFIPSGYGQASARGVAVWNGFVYVVGNVTKDGWQHAFLLKTPVPEPRCIYVVSALVGIALFRRRLTGAAL